ncbi:hypothetical protein DFQ27_006243 [Actinomortierella ambigua]|uniref:Uncharacterized protein n=1 Tax=Actinomortierella ambigua TaxID=1343610 RepID=A0A9P6QJD4_9FUNG|nr:hypothetical protein DFQ27_006243 [Actinomortierella ambigua]
MTATTFVSSLPSPGPVMIGPASVHPIPEGSLSDLDRAALQKELEQLKSSIQDSQNIYSTTYASIPGFQELVLTTHAQVAQAKKAVLETRQQIQHQHRHHHHHQQSEEPSSSSASYSSSSTTPPPSSATPSPPSSPISRPDAPDESSMDVDDDHTRLARLEREHELLGKKLTQVLRDKAEAEETKKRLSDYMTWAKARARDIESKLQE